MRRPGFVALLLLAAALPVAAAESPAEAARRLLAAYHEDLTRIDQARDLLEQALGTDSRVENFIELARAHFLFGEVRAATEDGKLAAYDRGREVARRAVELAPRNARAHLWYAINTGRFGQTKGVLRSLFLLPTMREEVDILLELEPDSAAVHLVAGNLLAAVPGLFGGDKTKAEEHLQKAVTLEPNYTAARIDLARFLIKAGRPGEARPHLQAVLDEKNPSSRPDWAVRHLPRARELLESLGPAR